MNTRSDFHNTFTIHHKQNPKIKFRQNFKTDDKIIYAEILSHMITNSIIQQKKTRLTRFFIIRYFHNIIASSFAFTHIVSMFYQENEDKDQKKTNLKNSTRILDGGNKNCDNKMRHATQ